MKYLICFSKVSTFQLTTKTLPTLINLQKSFIDILPSKLFFDSRFPANKQTIMTHFSLSFPQKSFLNELNQLIN